LRRAQCAAQIRAGRPARRSSRPIRWRGSSGLIAKAEMTGAGAPGEILLPPSMGAVPAHHPVTAGGDRVVGENYIQKRNQNTYMRTL